MKVLTVQELNTIARDLLAECEELNEVWVSGEVSNLTRHSSGHYYFTLKDNSSEIRCTFFKYARSRSGIEIEENMKVLVFGSMNVYLPKGSLGFNVLEVKAQGVGALYLAFEALRKKLESEGLFDSQRKRVLPRYPRTIGVVTSPTGAAIRDILNITERRFPADILLAPALVQGEGAGESIAKGISLLNKAEVDVIIVGRGGGSLEDLWAFNEETVARAIYASKVPVISAVGHETDTTISDMVADVRAPTPSAAAEIVLPDREDEMRNLVQILALAKGSLKFVLDHMRDRLDRAARAFSPDIMRRSLQERQMGLDELSGSLNDLIERNLQEKRNRLESMQASLDGLSPMNVLQRGYCLVQRKDGSLITSSSTVSLGEIIKITVKDGIIEANVVRKG